MADYLRLDMPADILEEQVVNRYALRDYDMSLYVPCSKISSDHTILIIYHDGFEYRLVPAKWGFLPVPGFHHDPITSRYAPFPHAADASRFREAFKRRRCIMLIDGFYVWERIDFEHSNLRLFTNNGKLLPLAGLWNVEVDDEGNHRYVCVPAMVPARREIVTSKGNVLLILDDDCVKEWFDPRMETVDSLYNCWMSSAIYALDVTPTRFNQRLHVWRNRG